MNEGNYPIPGNMQQCSQSEPSPQWASSSISPLFIPRKPPATPNICTRAFKHALECEPPAAVSVQSFWNQHSAFLSACLSVWHTTREVGTFCSTASPAPIHRASALGGLCCRHWGSWPRGGVTDGALDLYTLARCGRGGALDVVLVCMRFNVREGPLLCNMQPVKYRKHLNSSSGFLFPVQLYWFGRLVLIYLAKQLEMWKGAFSVCQKPEFWIVNHHFLEDQLVVFSKVLTWKFSPSKMVRFSQV